MVSIPNSRCQCTFKFQRVLSAFPVERLPELLPEELLREVFAKHKCIFRGIFHPALVTWAFLCQVIRDGKDATCRAAVAKISNFLIQIGRNAPHANTGDYCYARAKLKPSAIRELAIHIASLVLDNQEESWQWKKRNTVLIDGFTFKMPDTPKNQAVYPQHTAQTTSDWCHPPIDAAVIACNRELRLQYRQSSTSDAAISRYRLRDLTPSAECDDAKIIEKYPIARTIPSAGAYPVLVQREMDFCLIDVNRKWVTVTNLF